MNRHRQTAPAGPFRANDRQGRHPTTLRHIPELHVCLAGIQENHEYPSQFASYLGNPGLHKNVHLNGKI
jgi:hypothetical protein